MSRRPNAPNHSTRGRLSLSSRGTRSPHKAKLASGGDSDNSDAASMHRDGPEGAVSDWMSKQISDKAGSPGLFQSAPSKEMGTPGPPPLLLKKGGRVNEYYPTASNSEGRQALLSELEIDYSTGGSGKGGVWPAKEEATQLQRVYTARDSAPAFSNFVHSFLFTPPPPPLPG